MKAQAIQPTKVSFGVSSNRSKGFTLIELMVTLVILGILLGAGIPGMRSLLDNMSVRTSSDKLVNALAYARGEAVARVEDVSICASNDEATCSGTWANGWIVRDSGGAILRVVNNSASATAISGGPGAPGITFDDQGVNQSGVINFVLSKPDLDSARQVSLSPIGSTSVSIVAAPSS